MRPAEASPPPSRPGDEPTHMISPIAIINRKGGALPLHQTADAALSGRPSLAPVPEALAETFAGYVELARQFTPQGASYLENHRGH